MNVAICLLYLLNNTLLNDYDATQNIGRTKSIGIIISLQQKIQAADTVRKLKIRSKKGGKGKDPRIPLVETSFRSSLNRIVQK
jgi:hypothetical protein